LFAGSAAGAFPLAYGTGNRNISIYFSSTTALTTGGSLTITHSNVPGISAVSITDGTYTVGSLANSSWMITSSGVVASGTISMRLTAGHMFTTSAANNLRITQAGSVSGMHQPGGGSIPDFQAIRTGLTLPNLTQAHYIGADVNEISTITNAAASGDWNDPSTWDLSIMPGCNDIVYVSNGYTVTVEFCWESIQEFNNHDIGDSYCNQW